MRTTNIEIYYEKNYFSLDFIYVDFFISKVDGFDVVENSIVLKFSTSYPKLGSEPAINLKQLNELVIFINDLSISEFKTLHLNTDQFGPAEYKHRIASILCT